MIFLSKGFYMAKMYVKAVEIQKIKNINLI